MTIRPAPWGAFAAVLGLFACQDDPWVFRSLDAAFIDRAPMTDLSSRMDTDVTLKSLDVMSEVADTNSPESIQSDALLPSADVSTLEDSTTDDRLPLTDFVDVPTAQESGLDVPDVVAVDADIFRLNQRSCPSTSARGCGMVVFAGGTFIQGEGSPSLNATPLINTTVGPFAIDAYEVTVSRFRLFWQARSESAAPVVLRARPIAYRGGSILWSAVPAQPPIPLDAEFNWSETNVSAADHPMNGVDYWLAQEFCVWDGGRLPTEAEWEFAARGVMTPTLASGRAYPWGNVSPGIRGACERAQFTDCAGTDGRRTRRVGSFAGVIGVFDLAGNVAEWTADSLRAYSSCRRSDTDPLCSDPPSEDRVVRGGSWSFNDAIFLRGASRLPATATDRSRDYGFRCARNIP